MNNPLLEYTKKPGTFVFLPSQGKYYTEAPQLSADGDIEVHPLTAIDEMYLKNPDGLYNNESIYKVIKNCVPGIKDPTEIAVIDLDAIFVAMRIATYGDTMDVESKCPKCSHTSQYTVSLSNLLAGMKKMSDMDSVEINGLTVNVRPYTLESNTRLGEYTMNVAIAAAKVQETANDPSSEARQELTNAITNGSDSLLDLVAECIVSVEMPDNVITDQELIKPFVKQLSAVEYNKLRDTISHLSDDLFSRKFTFTCEKCNETSEGEVNFNPANFFV